ncbi:MAG: acylphosphatase [Saprospiraceae bacterium]|jgi:acylphosphatase
MEFVKIKVRGKVHGVAFRYYTKIRAESLNLTGTVKNLEDSSVLIYASGSIISVNGLISWCESGGSPAAEVNHVEVTNLDINSLERFTDFSIIR